MFFPSSPPSSDRNMWSCNENLDWFSWTANVLIEDTFFFSMVKAEKYCLPPSVTRVRFDLFRYCFFICKMKMILTYYTSEHRLINVW